MNSQLAERLNGIQMVLMGHFAGGAGMPNAVIGGEREILVNDFLGQVLPRLFRFGRGAITDSVGSPTTGQVDAIMELPFSPSYPMPGGSERLYLAESVCSAIEVKSNLYKQWDEAQETTRKVKLLSRDLRQTSGLLLGQSPQEEPGFEVSAKIPCYFVGFLGHSTLKGLEKAINDTPANSRPDGVLVIESGCFIGITTRAEGVSGLHGFICDLMAHANAALQMAYPNLRSYGDLQKK